MAVFASIFDLATLACVPAAAARASHRLRRCPMSPWRRRCLEVLLLRPRAVNVAAFATVIAAVVVSAMSGLVGAQGPWYITLVQHLKLAMGACAFTYAPLWLAGRWRLGVLLREAQAVRVRDLGSTPDPAEVAARRVQWQAYLNSPEAVHLLNFVVNRSALGSVLLVCLVLAMGTGQLFELVLRDTIQFQKIIFACVLPCLAIYIMLLHFRTLGRFNAILDMQRCGGCGYDLGPLLPEDERLPAGTPIGLARCPECATRWPLVPPPLFAEDAKAGSAKAPFPRLKAP